MAFCKRWDLRFLFVAELVTNRGATVGAFLRGTEEEARKYQAGCGLLEGITCQDTRGNSLRDWNRFATGKGRSDAVASQKPRKSSILGTHPRIFLHLWTGLSQDRNSQFRRILSSITSMAIHADQPALLPEVIDSSASMIRPVGFIAMGPAWLQLHHRRYYDQNLARPALGTSGHRLAFDSDGELRVRWKHLN